MEKRNQVLSCKCGTSGTFEFERAHEAFGDDIGFISLSSGFTYRSEADAGGRVMCKCGEVVFNMKTS
jgi:hypothetical protein